MCTLYRMTTRLSHRGPVHTSRWMVLTLARDSSAAPHGHVRWRQARVRAAVIRVHFVGDGGLGSVQQVVETSSGAPWLMPAAVSGFSQRLVGAGPAGAVPASQSSGMWSRSACRVAPCGETRSRPRRMTGAVRPVTATGSDEPSAVRPCREEGGPCHGAQRVADCRGRPIFRKARETREPDGRSG